MARAAIALGVAVGMVLVIRDGVATELGRRDPMRAAVIQPSDARLALLAARAKVDGGASPAAVRALVDKALARDVTLPAAIELRALRAEADGDDVGAARLFSLSDQIGRRSLPTRLWLIQKSVDAGDVNGALKDFDIALRTSAAAPPILFPVLTGAVSDPHLVAPIARLLDRPSDWRAMFLHYAVVERHAPPGVSDLVLRIGDRSLLRGQGADQALIAELVGQTDFAKARRVHDAFHPASRSWVADGDFSRPERTYPFGWRLIENGALGATRDRIDGRLVLVYQATGGAGGVVATQLLTLPSGRYSLTARTAAADGRADPPYWTLTCAESGGVQIMRLDQPATAGLVASGDLVVPDGCGGQWLALHVRGADAPSQTGAIAQVTLVRR